MLTVPLPEDTGLDGDGRPKVRRFRSRHRDLGARLAAFRACHGVTQAEVARAVGARDHTTVSYWERGVTVPERILRERVVELVDGRRWACRCRIYGRIQVQPHGGAVMATSVLGGLHHAYRRAA